MTELKLSQIAIDAGTQIRVKTDEQTVQDYTELLMQDTVFPPVDVFFDGVNYYLADGFHRYLAHKRCVKDRIAVNIHNGTARDARVFAATANNGHGLRMSKEDKRNAVLVYLNDFELAMLTDREISRRTGVSHPYVGKLRDELENPPKKAEKKKEKNDVVEPAKDREPKYDEGEDKVQELAVQVTELADENETLKKKLEASAGDKEAQDVVSELRSQIQRLEAENQTLKTSRDSFQSKVAELTKMVGYWKKRAEKAEKVTS